MAAAAPGQSTAGPDEGKRKRMRDTTLYVVVANYGASANDLRAAAMADHVAYLRSNAHRLRFAGPLLQDDGETPSGSLAILEASERGEAESYIADEAFSRAGMFDDVQIHRYVTGTGRRQFEVELDPARALFMCRWLAEPGSALSADDVVRPPEADGVGTVEHGALVSDDANRAIGRFSIVEAADRCQAEDVVAAQVPGGLDVASRVVSRWRIGQALAGV